MLKPTNKVAIVYRLESDKAVNMARDVVHWFYERGVEVFTAPNQKLLPKTKFIKTAKTLDSLSFVLVLGGDGTYLRSVKLINGKPIPVLGFNMGSLGFLTSSTSDQLFDNLEKTLANKMEIRRRMLLETMVLRRGKKRCQAIALNDIVIERGSNSQIINTSVSSEKFLINHVKADALIVASPTGSTAYNLAAGGPLLDPEVKALILTPVAPHSLTSRPMIFPFDRKLSFRVQGKKEESYLIVDGQKLTGLTHEDEVFVYQCAHDHYLIQSPEHNFFHLLREKLKFGDRA